MFEVAEGARLQGEEGRNNFDEPGEAFAVIDLTFWTDFSFRGGLTACLLEGKFSW